MCRQCFVPKEASRNRVPHRVTAFQPSNSAASRRPSSPIDRSVRWYCECNVGVTTEYPAPETYTMCIRAYADTQWSWTTPPPEFLECVGECHADTQWSWTTPPPEFLECVGEWIRQKQPARLATKARIGGPVPIAAVDKYINLAFIHEVIGTRKVTRNSQSVSATIVQSWGPLRIRVSAYPLLHTAQEPRGRVGRSQLVHTSEIRGEGWPKSTAYPRIRIRRVYISGAGYSVVKP